MFERSADGTDWCATFTIAGQPDRWIQVTSNSLNMAYLHQNAPTDLVNAAVPVGGLRLQEWTAGTFATWRFDPGNSAKDVAQLVDQMFQMLLGSGADYSVDVELTPLAKR